MSVEAEIVRAVEVAVERAIAAHQRPVQRITYKVREAAEALGVSEQFIRRLIANGDVVAQSTGPNGHLMVSVASLEAWANRAEQGSAA